MTDLEADKQIERVRYNAHAEQPKGVLQLGSDVIPAALAAPYLAYEAAIAQNVTSDDIVLELGAGQGEHSLIILRQGAQLRALDISETSLASLRQRAADFKDNLQIFVGDMEAPDIADASLDVVTSAGAMSYADKQQLVQSIHRILRPGGYFIAIDSWNHNPIYRFNRWRHFRRGERTKMTLQNMPDRQTLGLFQSDFDVEVRYFGCLSFLVPLFRIFLSGHQTSRILSFTDRMLPKKILAFKILIVAQKK